MLTFRAFITAIAISICATLGVSAQQTGPVHPGDGPQFTIEVTQGTTNLGKIVVRLWPDVAPKHVAFFEARVAEKFYDSTAFHRCIANFMIQGGDPNSKNGPRQTWGSGGYKDKVPAEFSNKQHMRGVLSAARTNDPNSFGGQFFICVANANWLDGQYTAFGEVVSGMEVADVIVKAPQDGANNPLEKISMRITKNKVVETKPSKQARTKKSKSKKTK
ncbi:MAG: peptidylprolyl isomerase [Bacteroidota bacterium]|jgi:peptidyl-prolyl cis-trans isomerase B (cyclophilin B)